MAANTGRDRSSTGGKIPRIGHTPPPHPSPPHRTHRFLAILRALSQRSFLNDSSSLARILTLESNSSNIGHHHVLRSTTPRPSRHLANEKRNSTRARHFSPSPSFPRLRKRERIVGEKRDGTRTDQSAVADSSLFFFLLNSIGHKEVKRRRRRRKGEEEGGKSEKVK